MPTTWINALSLAVAIVALQGCSSLEEQIPQDGPDMETIYNEYAGGSVNTTTTAPNETAVVDTRPLLKATPPTLNAYTRDASNELEGLFKTLPNPTLFMYTRPHVVGRDGIPVPGYTTQFKMYDRDHFALPGEVQ